jgi:hypothetical protein
MRRTFQDITRAADVSSVVKRSLSAHATEAMEVAVMHERQRPNYWRERV